jgi:predicted dehydrogenase
VRHSSIGRNSHLKRRAAAAGMLGAIRVVQVEYAQDWLATPLEAMGHKQAAWRTDPALSGAGGCLGDIATHALPSRGLH